MKRLRSAVNEGDGLLLHHWDTDGMVSAALLLKELDQVKSSDLKTFTPTIGNYLLNDKDRESIESIDPDFVIVVDMALPKDSIEFLDTFGDVFIFDHHLQDRHEVELHHNPIIDGNSPEEYPSASWVVNDFLERVPDLLSILGAFGDREEKLKQNDQVMEVVGSVLDKIECEFDEVLDCAYHLDSNYKLGKREKVTEMPCSLKDVERPEKILKREDLKENIDKLQEAIENETKGELEEVKNGVLLREMESPYNIISTVTRKLAWAREDKIVIVVNSKFMEDQTQIYIRGPIPDSQEIIEMLKDRGFSAGGKSDVVGMVIPDTDKEKTLSDILKRL